MLVKWPCPVKGIFLKPNVPRSFPFDLLHCSSTFLDTKANNHTNDLKVGFLHESVYANTFCPYHLRFHRNMRCLKNCVTNSHKSSPVLCFHLHQRSRFYPVTLCSMTAVSTWKKSFSRLPGLLNLLAAQWFWSFLVQKEVIKTSTVLRKLSQNRYDESLNWSKQMAFQNTIMFPWFISHHPPF